MDNKCDNGEWENFADIAPYTFEELIGPKNKNVFEIPLFQRNYSWNQESCELFFNDILDAYKKRKKYYIGNFMFYGADKNPKINKFILIDGQQRITTLLLLLCAMRDNYKSLSSINKDFIRHNNEKARYKYKLKQNYNDYEPFLKVLSGDYRETKTDDDKVPIYKIYNRFCGLLKLYVKEEDAKGLYKTIKNLESVGINFKNNNLQRIQDIFEKMNSTGTELSAADLIRNLLLFSKTTKEQEELHKYWKTLEDTLGEGYISGFSKSFLIEHIKEDVKNSDVYRVFKKEYMNKNHERTLKQLVKFSVYYSIIKKQEFYIIDDNGYDYKKVDYKDKNHDDLRTTFALLNTMGSDNLDPLFLQLFELYYDNNIGRLNEICELILEFLIRYRITSAATGSGALNAKVLSIIKIIDDNNARATKKDIYNELSDNDPNVRFRYPDDQSLKNSLSEPIQTLSYAKVLLYQLSRREGLEFRKRYDSSITIEHLMPQTINPETPDGKWWIENLGGKDAYKIVHNDYLDLIGNYALVTNSLNPALSNSQWSNKREIIKERALDARTTKVSKSKNWTKREIKKRNDQLINEIINTITGPKHEKTSGKKWL